MLTLWTEIVGPDWPIYAIGAVCAVFAAGTIGGLCIWAAWCSPKPRNGR